VAVRILRGRAETIAADRKRTATLLDTVAERRQPAVRVWLPHRQIAFGRRDVRTDGYDRARQRARAHDFDPVERSVGGRAVAYTGSTLAFARVEPIGDARSDIDTRYEAVTDALSTALETLGVEANRGEPQRSFCPGTHSLSAAGKLVGIAQRVRRTVAMTAGILLPGEHGTIATVLEDVYDALEVPFDPGSVGSVARARGSAVEPETVRATVEDALVGDRRREIIQV